MIRLLITLAIPLCLSACFSALASSGTSNEMSSVKAFTIDLDNGAVTAESGIVIKTLVSPQPRVPDDGVIPEELARPDSPAAIREEAVEEFSVQHPVAYDRTLAHGAEVKPLGEAEEFSVDGTVVSVPREKTARAARKQAQSWARIAQNPVGVRLYPGSGPYHRVFTNPGYSYVQGSVYLPCGVVSLDARSETAFAYVGGWGAGDKGTAVDAGFQYSPVYKNYALFIRGQTSAHQQRKQISERPRFVCGHKVRFKFLAYSDTELRFSAYGSTADDNGRNRVKHDEIEAHLHHGKGYSWPANGGGPVNGIILKRMTTIGQSGIERTLPPGLTWDTDGSYFGHTAKSKEPLVRWSDLLVGTVDSHGNPAHLVRWGTAQTFRAANPDALDYPSTAVIVFCGGCVSEANAIDLSGAAIPEDRP
jgi:hypothetical protein